MVFDIPNKLSHTTIALHWIVSLTIIIMLSSGVYMAETSTWSLYPWHKSFGVCVFFIVLARVAWRIKNGWPIPLGHSNEFQLFVAKFVHWILILGTILMPISGFLMSAFGGNGVEVFSFSIIDFNPDPENPGKKLAHNAMLASFFHDSHGWIGYGLIAAVILHVLAALKHHIIDKDSTLKRMLGVKI